MKKLTKFQTKAQKCSNVHFIREIWCSNREIGGFDEKLGELAGMLQKFYGTAQVKLEWVPKRKVGSGTIWSVNNLSVPNFICAEPKFFTCWDLQQGSPSTGENGTGAEKSVRLR